MPAACKNCGCSEIDSDPARGDAVCTNCGSVIDNQIIVAEVEFEENSAGGANVIGQFISSEGGRNFTFGGTFKNGYGQDGRQATLNNGKFMITSCGNQLKFSPHCLDTAFMFYKLAVSKRLTQGRRLPHVIGACLYLVSRTEKTPHLLVDISDACNVDLRLLGKTYLLLARELCIEVPMIDPCLYIHRFTHQLGFKEKENEIAMTAVRIVSRMKRDWLQYGRRPSGLCGAALVVAARLHGFKIKTSKVVKVVRVAQSTLIKRLHDFARTPTSRLTIDEFHKVDLEEEMDPPCFTAGRVRLKHAQIFEEKLNLSSPELLAQVALTQKAVERLIIKRKTIEEQIDTDEQTVRETPVETVLPKDIKETESVDKPTNELSTDALAVNLANVTTLTNDTLQQVTNATVSLQKLVSLGDEETKTAAEETKELEDLNIEGLDDDELNEFLLNDQEIELKTKIWLEENQEFLDKQKEKEELAAKELEENNGKPKIKRKYHKRKRENIEAATADEAIQTLLTEKRLSNKINYDVLRGLKQDIDDADAGPSKSVKLELETVIESGPVVKEERRILKSVLKRSKFIEKEDKEPHLKNITFSSDTKSEPKLPNNSGQSTSTSNEIIVDNSHLKVESKENILKSEKEVIVESGPIAIDDNDVEIGDNHDEDEYGNVSAASLFGHKDDGYNEYVEVYDDDEEDTAFY